MDQFYPKDQVNKIDEFGFTSVNLDILLRWTDRYKTYWTIR